MRVRLLEYGKLFIIKRLFFLKKKKYWIYEKDLDLKVRVINGNFIKKKNFKGVFIM